jgi:hypothetical protein
VRSDVVVIGGASRVAENGSGGLKFFDRGRSAWPASFSSSVTVTPVLSYYLLAGRRDGPLNCEKPKRSTGHAPHVRFGSKADMCSATRAALEAEMLVLRQQIIVLRRGRPSRVPFLAVDKMVLGWVCQLFPKTREALAIVRLFAGIAQVSDVTGARNRGLVRAGPRCG